MLRQLSHRLKDRLTGARLHSCYSQEKDVLVMQFTSDDQEFFIQVIMRSDLSMIRVPANLSRARKNSVNLFTEIDNSLVEDIFCFENERCLCIKFKSNWSLLIKMFGNQSNVILCGKGNAHALYKNKLTTDLNLSISEMNRKFEVSRPRLDELNGEFQKMLPTLGGAVKKYIEKSGYDEMTMNEKWALIEQILQTLENPDYYLYQQESGPALSLFEQPGCFFQSRDVIEALNEFFLQYIRVNQLTGERKLLLKVLERRKKRADGSIQKSQNRLTQLEREVGHREVADMIMAHMHLISPGAKTVELPDFKTGKLISIKLKPTLSPQKNAEQYYRKSKNQSKEVAVLQQNLINSQLELATVEEHIEFVQRCQDLKLLRNYTKDHKLAPTKQTKEVGSLFKEFRFDNFVILVGKNAANNDLLTQKFSHKEDLWLHAKDVKGSHVIIKHSPGKPFPSTVIENAAKLAAYYSKRKNDTLCPVIYTPKKYVRKTKGSAAGQVVVEREKVLLVTPNAGSLGNGNF